jgi:mannosyl-oligosaccharide alpha-1,2-mannosidase
MGLTLIDSLDTLLVMQLDEEAELALQWIEQSLSFGEQEEINLFEVTIRVLGGLLQAYKCAHYGAISPLHR